MLFIKSLATVAILALTQAAPVPKPQAKNIFNYEVINVDGSNFQQTSSFVELEKRAVVTETIGFTTTSTTVVPGKKRTVWVTADDDATTAATEITDAATEATTTAEVEATTAAEETTETTLANVLTDNQNKAVSQTLTVIDGTTFIVSKVISTIIPATTYTYESTYTSTINGVVETGVATIVTSSTASETAETTATVQEATISTSPSATSSAPASTSSTSTPTSSTSTPTTTAASSTSTSSISASSTTESGTPYTTIVVDDGVCEVYYDDEDGTDSIYYVSGVEAQTASSTTTITSVVYETVSI